MSIFVSHSESCHAGHSHQLFHVSAVVGTHFQMEGVIADMISRRATLLTHVALPSLLGTIGVLVLSLVLNLGVIGIFSAPLLWKPCRSSNQASERKEQWGRLLHHQPHKGWFTFQRKGLGCLSFWLLTAHSSACLTPIVLSFRDEDFDT